MDERGQGHDQVDALVMPIFRGQRSLRDVPRHPVDDRAPSRTARASMSEPPWVGGRRRREDYAVRTEKQQGCSAASKSAPTIGLPTRRLQSNFVAARLDETENHAHWAGNPENVGLDRTLIG